MPANLEKIQQWPQDWKRSVSIPITKKGNAKEWLSYCTIALISHTSQVMLKSLQARLQQYLNMNFQMFKLDSEKAEESEIKLSTSVGSLKKQESSRYTSTCALLTVPKALTVWIKTNCGKVLTCWEYQTIWPASWETYMQVKNLQLELDMNNRLVTNWKRSTLKLYIVTLLI